MFAVEFLLLIYFENWNEYIFEILVQERLCVDENIIVIPIPRSSTLIAALSDSCLVTDDIAFGNFLTHNVGWHAYCRIQCPKF